ncbi:hypothetical protein BO71DRAFT_198721 [Aspergillus ellipticus CBS 707.79]|uniref:Uncharacterized protein n=1 Tax=Aspergillus ellipticus CBS 707.79 TaxID=1448320 RepID=A0A319EW05_9EURO|nr:hypothetical protein BO71DRAFT_198721 [Aspergillus ellipticus CBS 707.79]
MIVRQAHPKSRRPDHAPTSNSPQPDTLLAILTATPRNAYITPASSQRDFPTQNLTQRRQTPRRPLIDATESPSRLTKLILISFPSNMPCVPLPCPNIILSTDSTIIIHIGPGRTYSFRIRPSMLITSELVVFPNDTLLIANITIKYISHYQTS